MCGKCRLNWRWIYLYMLQIATCITFPPVLFFLAPPTLTMAHFAPCLTPLVIMEITHTENLTYQNKAGNSMSSRLNYNWFILQANENHAAGLVKLLLHILTNRWQLDHFSTVWRIGTILIGVIGHLLYYPWIASTLPSWWVSEWAMNAITKHR